VIRARLYQLPKLAPRVFDGQAYYDRHIRPFVERFGERNGPVEVTPIPPSRLVQSPDAVEVRAPPVPRAA
jgi:hypothetical protein